jgi:hypothetical protein
MAVSTHIGIDVLHAYYIANFSSISTDVAVKLTGDKPHDVYKSR